MKSDKLQTVLHEYSYLKSNFTLKSHPKNYKSKKIYKIISNVYHSVTKKFHLISKSILIKQILKKKHLRSKPKQNSNSETYNLFLCVTKLGKN